MRLVSAADPIIEAIKDAPVCIFDTETRSLRPHADGKILAGLGVKPIHGEGFYISFRHADSKNAPMRELKRVCDALRGKTIVGHNVKFDQAVILQEGIDLSSERYVDSLVMTRLTYEDLPTYELEQLGVRVLKIADAGEAKRTLRAYRATLAKARGVKLEEITYDMVPADVICEYVAWDLSLPEQLYLHTLPLIEERGLTDLFELEVSLTRALFRMETRGVQLDQSFVDDKLVEIASLVEKFERQAYKQAGREFNLASSDEIRDAFHGLTPSVKSPVMTSGGKKGVQKESWAKDVLEKIKHPLADTIGRWRKVDSARKFYETLKENSDSQGVLHPSFHQAGAKTGRFSCSKPNAQNIPRHKGKAGMGKSAIVDIKKREDKKRRYQDAGRTQIAFDAELEEELQDPLEHRLLGSVRSAFVARPGHLWLVADYSQIELRITADYANERAMIRAFELGLDIHKLNTLAVFGRLPDENDPLYKWMRDAAKQLGFGLVYGMGVSLLAFETGTSKTEAEGFMDAFFERYPKLRSAIKKAQDTCLNNDFLRNRWGRRRYLPSEKLYKAFNFAVQGCLPADTRVLTQRGWERIGDLADVSIVWTGERWASAKKLNRGAARRVRVYLSDGTTFDCDERHKLLVDGGVWPTWASVAELEGLRLVEDNNQHWGEQIGSVDDWFFFGLMLGDGFISRKGDRWGCAFGPSDLDKGNLERMLTWLDLHKIRGYDKRTGKPRKGISVRYSRKGRKSGGGDIGGWTPEALELWRWFGLTADRGQCRTKRLPPVAFRLDRVRREALLMGYYAADGSKTKSRNYTGVGHIESVNGQLSRDMVKLAKTLGLNARVSQGNMRGKPVTGVDFFVNKRPLICERVEFLGREEMFTLSVDDDRHAFSTEGLISKNTAADMFKHVINELDAVILARGLLAYMLLNIHDEIITEIRIEDALTAIPVLLDKMIDIPKITRVPIRVDASVTFGRWSEKRSIACRKCDGAGVTTSRSEDELLRALYGGDQRLLDETIVQACEDCAGKGYDLSRVFEEENRR